MGAERSFFCPRCPHRWRGPRPEPPECVACWFRGGGRRRVLMEPVAELPEPEVWALAELIAWTLRDGPKSLVRLACVLDERATVLLPALRESGWFWSFGGKWHLGIAGRAYLESG